MHDVICFRNTKECFRSPIYLTQQCSVVFDRFISSEKMKNSSPKKLSADCWPTVGRQSANSRTTVDRQSDDSRPTVGRQSANCWPTVGRLSFTAFYENLLPAVGRLLAAILRVNNQGTFWPNFIRIRQIYIPY